jgi:hypothetical protein
MRTIFKSLIAVAVLVVVVGLQSACSSAPVQEMSNARQAIQAAREVGAARFSPGLLNNAVLLLERARKQLESGEYRRARKNAISAHKEAVKARRKALSSAKP